MFMTIIEEKQLHFCRYPNIRRLRLLWWMCCNLSLLCLLHILVFYKILRMVGGQKTSMNVYNMHIIHFCRIGFLQKQILWVDRTYGIRSYLRYNSLTKLWGVSVTIEMKNYVLVNFTNSLIYCSSFGICLFCKKLRMYERGKEW